MNSIDFRIKGTQPLLFNREPSPFEDSPDLSAKTSKRKDEKPSEEAARHLHTINGNGKGRQAVIPAILLRKCLQSVTTLALGRSTPGHPWVQIVKGGVIIEPASMLLEPQNWTLDVRRAGTKGRGTGAMLYRPRFDDWSVKGVVSYDDRHLSGQDVRKLFDEAGRFQGLASYRIGNGGPFGSFIVTEWKE
jgi:hypothetical protein